MSPARPSFARQSREVSALLPGLHQHGRSKGDLELMTDGTKEALAVVPAYRESTESWWALFGDLRASGLGMPRLLVADGATGAWAVCGS